MIIIKERDKTFVNSQYRVAGRWEQSYRAGFYIIDARRAAIEKKSGGRTALDH
jgi:hypothetical protein